MLHLSQSACNADRRPFQIDVDAQAEREAAAMAWMEENLDVSQPVPTLRLLAAQVEEARERGLKPTRHVRYPLAASLRAHAKISNAFKGNRVKVNMFDNEITTQGDRERRAARRAARAELLKTLQQMPVQAVPRHMAGRLVDAGERTLHRACAAGELRVLKIGESRVVPVRDLANYLRRRIA